MSPSPARVLFVSSESRPFASTGGLGDVADALPRALTRAGLPVDRVMPLYRKVREGQERGGYTLHRSPHTLQITLGGEVIPAEIHFTEFQGVTTYFVGCEEFFDRSELYALPHREYSDNFHRFLFFQMAVVALVDALGQPYDVLHLNDWQCGLIPLLLRRGLRGTGRVARERVLFTIHNLAYQGLYPARYLYLTQLPGNLLSQYPEMEFYGQINCMKAGISRADRVNTVSPSYAREILQPEFGCGLDGVLRSLRSPVLGVVNGVDVDQWNPETDPTLPAHYTAARLSGKETCKRELLRETGLTYNPEIPLLVMISRLVDQKGLKVIDDAMERMMRLPLQFLMLGSGEAHYHDLLNGWTARWPDRFKAVIGFDADLSHRMEAGGDFFLMPSEFEPCGLNQLYSLRYGTVPIVNQTGGLQDTVLDLRTDPAQGTGLRMGAYTAESLLECVRDAISLFHDKTAFRHARRNGMRTDVSWEQTARDYLNLYSQL